MKVPALDTKVGSVGDTYFVGSSDGCSTEIAARSQSEEDQTRLQAYMDRRADGPFGAARKMKSKNRMRDRVVP